MEEADWGPQAQRQGSLLKESCMVGRMQRRRKLVGGNGQVSVIGRVPLWWSNPARAAKEVRATGNLTLLPYLTPTVAAVFNSTLLKDRHNKHIWVKLGMPRDSGGSGIPPMTLPLVKSRE